MRRKLWGFLQAGMPMKAWLTVLWLCLAVFICFMALLSDLLVFKSMYNYRSPHFGWSELFLLPVSYCCAYTVNATSAACLLNTPALAVFSPIFGYSPLQRMYCQSRLLRIGCFFL